MEIDDLTSKYRRRLQLLKKKKKKKKEKKQKKQRHDLQALSIIKVSFIINFVNAF